MKNINTQIKESINQTKKWEDYDELVLPDGTKINMAKLLDEQDRAKAALAHIEPFFAGMIGKVRFVYTFHVDTQATDGYNIFVNPLFTSKLTLEQKVFVLAHEIMHNVLNHLRRSRELGHNMHEANIAADYEVNSQLEQMGITSESIMKATGALYDKKYNNMGYEQIFASKPQGPSQPQQDPQQKSNQNQQGGQQNQQSGNGGSGQQDSQQSQQGSDGGSSQQDSGRGSGNQGHVKPEDMTTNNSANNTHKNNGGVAGGFMDKQDGDKLAQEEGYEKDSMNESSREKDWKETALKESQKLKGNVAGALKAKIESLYKVSTNWKKTLRNIIGRSLNPADTRQAFANKNVLTSQSRVARTDKDKYDNLEYICCFIDSSGSMSDDQLKMVLSEVYSLALQKKPMRIVCVQCDTQIQWVKEYTKLQDLKKDAITQGVKGRGSTVLKPCWDLLKNDKRFKNRRAEIVLCFTDGYCDQYKRDSKTMQNLFWCILDNSGFRLEYPDANTKVLHFDTRNIK